MIVSRYCRSQIAHSLADERVISATTLSGWLMQTAVETGHRERMAGLMTRSRATRQAGRARDRRLAGHRERRMRSRARRLYQRAQTRGTRAALQWLAGEHRWQTTVYREAQRRACHALAEHLQQQLPALDWQAVLLAGLPELLRRAELQPPLVLRVPQAMLASLEHEVLPAGMHPEALPEGEEGYAWVETTTARVRIALSESLGELLGMLQVFQVREVDDGRN